MATYYLALGVDSSTTNDPQSDGLHYDAQYGFAVDNGDGQGIKVLGSGSGSSGRQFEAVQMGQSGAGANQNPLNIIVFTTFSAVDNLNSYLRIAFRPAHDMLPSPNVDPSPLSAGATNALLDGVLFSNLQQGNVSLVASSYGLPSGVNYGLAYTSAQQINGPQNTNAHFELTAEITVSSNGSTYNFKVDPEMMIDF